MAATLYRMKGIDLGFRPESLVTFSIDSSLSGYFRQRNRELHRSIEDELSAQPGVAEVGYSSYGIMKGGINLMEVVVDGYEETHWSAR